MLFAAEKKYDVTFYDQWALTPDTLLMSHAQRFWNEDRADSALLCYTIVANRYYEHRLTDSEAPLVIRALYNVGYLYHFRFYDFQKAYNNLALALELSEKHGYRDLQPYIYRDMAGVLFTNGDVHQYQNGDTTAMNCYKKGFFAATETGNHTALVSIFINIVNLVYLPEQLADIADVTEVFDTLSCRNIKLYTYAHLLYEGTRAYLLADYDEALRCFTQMDDHIESTDANSRLRYHLQVSSKLMQTHLARGDDRQGVAYMQAIEREAREGGMVDVLLDVYRVSYEYYRDHGQDELSRHYRLLYLEAKDSIMTHNNLENVNHARFINELDRVNEQVRLMAVENRVQRYIIAGVVLIVLVLLGIIMMVVRNKRQMQFKNQQLYQSSLAALESERRERQSIEAQLQALTEVKAGQPKYQSSTLTKDDKDIIYIKVREAMHDVGLICQPDFSIQMLAEAIGERQRSVSQAINEQFGDNFHALVGEYRIREACRRINDQEHYGRLSLTAIGESVGIRSRSQFTAVFKRVVGMTPSEYQRQALRAS